MRSFRPLLGAAALLAALGCKKCSQAPLPRVEGQASAASACRERGGEVTIALSALPTTLDWSRSHEASAQNYPVIHAMMRGLTTLDAQNQAGPGLARSWEVALTPRGSLALTADTPPRQVYTFHLDPAVVWSDGKTPLTARDFVFGWRRALLGAEAAELSDIVGAQEVLAARESQGTPGEVAARVEKALAGFAVEAPDPHTLRVTLRSPRSYFLSRIAYTYLFFPAPSADLEGKSEEELRRYYNEPANGKPMVLGAFQVKSWDRVAQRVELVQNPFDARKPATGAVSRLTLLQAALSPVLYNQCKIDFLLMDDPAALSKAPPDTERAPLLSVYWLGLNTSRLSLPLRKAIAHALDRGKLTQGLLPQARTAWSFLPPGMPGALPEGDPLAAALPRYDPAQAKQELAESGYQGEELTLLVRGSDTFLPELGIAEAVRAQLEAAGLKVRVATTANFTNDIKAQDGTIRYPLFLKRTGADYAHPQTLFTVFLPNGNHYTDWQKLEGGAPIAEFQRLLDAAAAESDPAKMKAAFAPAQELLLAKQVVAVPIYFPDRYYRKRPWLEGLGVDPFNFLTLRQMRVRAGP